MVAYSSEKRNFWGLNLIRFPLSIAIVIYHYRLVFYGAIPYGYNPIISYLYANGGLCTEIFFAISGLLLYWHHSQKLRSTENKEKDFLPFILKRMIRIYPLMILTTVCAAFCLWITLILFPEGHLISAGWATDSIHITLVAFVLSICGIQSGWVSDGDYAAVYGASWYLSVLMICNILFYLILKSCKRDRVKENCCFIFLIIFGVYLCLNSRICFPLMYSWTGRGYTSFFVGVLIAQIIPNINTNKKRYFSLIISVCFIFLYFFLFKLECLGNSRVATSLVMSPALLLCLTNSKLITVISHNRLISYLGNISFEVYLWHLPLVMWFYFIQDFLELNIDYNSKYILFTFLFIVIMVSIIGYELYEKPITAWCKKRLNKLYTDIT